MAGANAFVFDGTEFVPTDETSTATLNGFNPATNLYQGVVKATYLSTGVQIWAGDPPTPTITSVTNTPTGTFPNKVSNVTVEWSIDANTIVSHFDIYVSVGGGSYSKHNTNPVAANLTSYVYGQVSAGVSYSFQVVAVGVSTRTSPSAISSITVTAPAALTTLSVTATTDTSITWGWTVTANTFQSYEVQRSTDGITWQTAVAVAGSEGGTSFSSQWTGRTQNTNYYLRVRARNNNSHWSPYSASVLGTTDNTLPVAGTISVAKVAVTLNYNTADNQEITTTSTSVPRQWTVSVDPSNDVDYFKTELYKSNNGSTGWTLIKTWTQAQGTTAKTYTYEENISSSAVTRYFRTTQYDTYGETVLSSVVSAISDARRSNVVTTYEAGSAITQTVQGSNLSMYLPGAQDNLSPSGTYGWAESYDNNLNSYWASAQKYIFPSTFNPGWGSWNFFLYPDTDAFWSCKLNYYEFVSFDTRYNVFCQLYDGYSQIWHGSANEPTGLNGDKYVVYLGGNLGNQNTYTRANMNIEQTFGETGLASMFWNCRVVLRNPQSIANIIGYGIFEFRVNYTYRNRVEVNTTWYW